MGQPSAESKSKYQQSERGKAARRVWYQANRERALALERARQYRIRYGITIKQYDALLATQDSKCAICGAAESGTRKARGERYHHRYFAVDHCHKTGRIRGLLCVACNVALGKIEKWYAKHRAAVVTYLGHVP